MKTIYTFDSYRLDPYHRKLFRNEEVINLPSQPFEVLYVLVKYHGEIVSLANLLKEAWHGTFVDDGSIKFQIHTLRKKFGIGIGKDGVEIKTVPKKGYQFIGDVKLKIEKQLSRDSANQSYLVGRYHYDKATAKSVKQAIDSFESAVCEDDKFVDAFAALADSLILASSFGHQIISPQDGMSRAEVAARQALSLQKNNPNALAALGSIMSVYHWKWNDGMKFFRQAIRLTPDPVVRAWFALCLAARGDYSESKNIIQKALNLNPTILVLRALSARIAYLSKDYQYAISECQKGIEMEKYFYLNYLFLGHCFRQKNDFEGSLKMLKKAYELSDYHPAVLADIGCVNGLNGDRAKAKDVITKLVNLSSETYLSPYLIAHVYLGIKDYDGFFEFVELAYEERSTYLIFLTTDSVYDSVRHDSRFSDLVNRIGFAVNN